MKTPKDHIEFHRSLIMSTDLAALQETKRISEGKFEEAFAAENAYSLKRLEIANQLPFVDEALDLAIRNPEFHYRLTQLVCEFSPQSK